MYTKIIPLRSLQELEGDYPRTQALLQIYRIADFSCEDFNLAIGLIRNIKIRKDLITLYLTRVHVQN